MTMLDRMRQHQSWPGRSLALVCLAFVLFYIPDFLGGTGADAAATDTVAVVNGHLIRADEFRRAYQSQMQAYRLGLRRPDEQSRSPSSSDDQQILQQLVDERAALAGSRARGRQGEATPKWRSAFYAIPAFLENGASSARRAISSCWPLQNPPLTVSDFEDSIRRSLVMEKLRASVTEWLSVSDKEPGRISSPQRQGEARRRGVQRRQLPP